MKILVHDFSGHPFQLQLSRTLAGRGHDVRHLYCGSLPGVKGETSVRPDDPPTLVIDPVLVARPFERYSPLKRLASEVAYGRALARIIVTFRPNVVLSANTPLIAQALAQRASRRVGGRFVFWQQDVLSVAIRAALARRLGAAGRLLGLLSVVLERGLLRRSDAVVVISPDYLPLLASWGLDVSSYSVIENWAPLDEIAALPKRNEWSVEHGLAERPVFLYAGTLGLKHDPSVLLGLADALRSATVVVSSQGVGADWLRDRQYEAPRANLVLMPGVPYERLPELLASADVLVALLEPDAGVFSVPSKILTYLCAGRAVLAAVPTDNLAHRLVRDAGAGLAVVPGDRDAFVAAARRLLEDTALRERSAAAARAYAEQAFDAEEIGDRFERLLSPPAFRPAGRPSPASAPPALAVSFSRRGVSQPYEVCRRGDHPDAQ